MNSRHLVDPELLWSIEQPFPEISIETLANFRKMNDEVMKQFPVPKGLLVTVEDITVPGPEGAPDILIRITRPHAAADNSPAIYHVHGGGYITCSATQFDFQNVPLAEELNCPIFSVDYRLPPETAYPGPVEDCYAGLKWVHAHAAELNINPDRIGLKGESAGGGLVAALALLTRDRKEIPLTFQHMIAPMLDDRTSLRQDPHPYTGEFSWNRRANLFGWTCMLGGAPGSEGVSPYASAARETDLRGLPPAFISVGAMDLFMEESVEYALRLTRAGVGTDLRIYAGVPHHNLTLPGSRALDQMNRDSVEALRRSLFG